MKTLFNDPFYWQFQAPNTEDLDDFICSCNQYDGAPWDNLCSVKTLQVEQDILHLLQPSIRKLCEVSGVMMNMKMNRPWVSEYSRGDHQEVHDHNDADLVAVYFPEYKEGFSKFYFVDRGVNLRRPVMDLMRNSNQHIVDVKAGDVVFFPGHMLHGVSVHKHDIIRRSLSCNLWITQLTHTQQDGIHSEDDQ